MKLPRSDVIEAPFTAADLARAAGRPARRRAGRRRRRARGQRPLLDRDRLGRRLRRHHDRRRAGHRAGRRARRRPAGGAGRPEPRRRRGRRLPRRHRQHACWPKPRPSPERIDAALLDAFSLRGRRRARPAWPRRATRRRSRKVTPDRGLPPAGDRLPGLRLDRHRPAAPPPALDAGRAGRLRRGAGGLRADRAGAARRPARWPPRSRPSCPTARTPRDHPQPPGQPRVRPRAVAAPRPRRRCSARPTAASPPTGRPPPPRSTSAARSATTGRARRSCATSACWSTG